uniref:Uncharacterized protein n=1 Tax=Osugoroshi virus TaxID=2202814 RepID=A0A7R7T203_9VIRU|nr:hypothetical protein [Osugoroshi virus]
MDQSVNKLTAESTETPPPKPSGKPNRRGSGSRKKAAEKYRTHKNETVGKKFIDDRISKFILENACDVEELFGQLSISVPTTVPSQPIPITTHLIEEVAEQTVRTLVASCKVPTPDIEADIETVKSAASLQVFAKVRISQQNTPFQTISPDEDTLAEQVVRNASTAILPIASYIDQIGQVEVDGQTFIPVEEPTQGVFKSYNYVKLRDNIVEGADTVIDIPTGNALPIQDLIRLDQMGARGGELALYVISREDAIARNIIDANNVINPQVLANELIPPPEVAHIVEVRAGRRVLPPVDIFRRYAEFLSRVQKKLAYEKLPSLQLERAKGTSAQLVYAGEWHGDARHVASFRRVDGPSLFMGAAFELNVKHGPHTNERIAAISGTVYSRNSIPRLMQTLSQRVERK